MKTYSEKLRDPRWQRLRLKVMERDDWTCQHCQATEKTLNVHHRIYLRGREPWDYAPDLLITLCEDCHKEETDESSRAIEKAREYLLIALATQGHDASDIAMLAVLVYAFNEIADGYPVLHDFLVSLVWLLKRCKFSEMLYLAHLDKRWNDPDWEPVIVWREKSEGLPMMED